VILDKKIKTISTRNITKEQNNIGSQHDKSKCPSTKKLKQHHNINKPNTIFAISITTSNFHTKTKSLYLR
jgi:hypothetical protein